MRIERLVLREDREPVLFPSVWHSICSVQPFEDERVNDADQYFHREPATVARTIKLPEDDARLRAFAERLSKALLKKQWSASDLAREASKYTPRGVTVGRHVTAGYCRGAHMPTDKFLVPIAKALGMKPEELLPPPDGEREPYARATSSLNGRSRVVVDADVPSEVAMQILALIRGTDSKPLHAV